MKWFEIVIKLFQLVPSILASIKAAEEVFGPGNGAQKRAAVMAPMPADAPAELISAVGSFIDSAVAQLNVAGALKPSAPKP